MFVLFIVVPSVVVAMALVLLLDWVGVLPRLDGGPTAASGSWFERIPRGALFAAAGVMVAWILAWIVLLVIGMNILSS
jgi:hypothetical protein